MRRLMKRLQKCSVYKNSAARLEHSADFFHRSFGLAIMLESVQTKYGAEYFVLKRKVVYVSGDIRVFENCVLEFNDVGEPTWWLRLH